MNHDFDIKPEERLILELCHLEFTDGRKKYINLLINELTDWDYFCELSNNHGVSSLFYHNLHELGFLPDIPDTNSKFLKSIYLKSLGRNSYIAGSLQETLCLLNKAGIKAMLLKGSALELTVYGNSGLRQMTDADILVAEDQCLKANETLINNGYSSLPLKSPLYKYIILYLGKHLPSLVKNGISLDIHHDLFGKKGKLMTSMMYNTGYISDFKGQQVLIPTPQFMFLYLVSHLYRHEKNNESQLRLYTDLVVLTEKHFGEIFNDRLIEYANQANIRVILANSLFRLREFMGISFPVSFNSFIDSNRDFSSADKFIFFLRSPKNNPQINKSESYRNTIKEIPRFHRKIIFVLGDLFPSFGFMKRRYSCSGNLKVLPYYFLRVGKLLWLFGF